jgi:segregation and condensation protein A
VSTGYRPPGGSRPNAPAFFFSLEQEYKVRLDVFEGPLDLLLYLIKRDEVDIYDISIERITKEYLSFLEAFQTLNIELAGEFIVMAATLLYIKSRMLLPKDQQLPDEDADEDDPRWELIRQLVEYKKFKEAADRLREREALQEALFPRMPATPELPAAENLSLAEVGIFDLIHAFQQVLKRLENKTEDLREIFEENFTVGDKIESIMRRTEHGTQVRFAELFSDAASRAEIVVTFLAMLELIRMKQLVARQDEGFGEIWVERAPAGNALFQNTNPALN